MRIVSCIMERAAKDMQPLTHDLQLALLLLALQCTKQVLRVYDVHIVELEIRATGRQEVSCCLYRNSEPSQPPLTDVSSRAIGLSIPMTYFRSSL